MAQEAGAAQPIVDAMQQSVIDPVRKAVNTFSDWASLGPVKRAVKQSPLASQSTKRIPTAKELGWAVAAKPEPEKITGKKTIKKITISK